MAETTYSNDSTSSSRFAIPLKRSVYSDSCPKNGRKLMESIVESLRNFKGPVVINLHMSAISSEIFSIKIYSLLAHVGLLLFVCTISASVIRITNWAYSNIVAYLQCFHILSYHCDLPDHLMTHACWVRNLAYLNKLIPQSPLPWKWSDAHKEVCNILSLTS